MASDLFDGVRRGSFLLPPCAGVQRVPTRLDGLVLLEPEVHGDERGFFSETWRADAWAAHGVPTDFVQDNHSRSRLGTLRGVHFQTSPGQGKLVRVARGKVYDVAVDLRRESPTFGEWEAVELRDATQPHHHNPAARVRPGRRAPALRRARGAGFLLLQVHRVLRRRDRGR